MRHGKSYRKLGRTSSHRRATLRSLVTSLFAAEQGRIQTTLDKARETRPLAEKMITLARKDTLHARRQVLRFVRDRKVVGKLFSDIAPRFEGRPGGYTRIVKLGHRRGDNAEVALLELVERGAGAGSGESKPEADAKS